MKKIGILSALFAAVIALGGNTKPQTCAGSSLDVCLQSAVSEINKLKPGMTRQELLKTFEPSLGFYTSTAQGETYVYRKSPYIRIDVQFAPSSGGEKASAHGPTDVIASVSRAYLAVPEYD